MSISLSNPQLAVSFIINLTYQQHSTGWHDGILHKNFTKTAACKN